MAGHCSKHRNAKDFKKGDKVRLVCTGGRPWKCGADHLNEEFLVRDVSREPTDHSYDIGYRDVVHLGYSSKPGCTYWHEVLPRALEKINA